MYSLVTTASFALGKLFVLKFLPAIKVYGVGIAFYFTQLFTNQCILNYTRPEI